MIDKTLSANADGKRNAILLISKFLAQDNDFPAF